MEKCFQPSKEAILLTILHELTSFYALIYYCFGRGVKSTDQPYIFTGCITGTTLGQAQN